MFQDGEDLRRLPLTEHKKRLDDFADRVTGMEIVLRELVRSEQHSLTLARLRIWAELLRLNGRPSAYLDSFVWNVKADL